jgi:hypothetical protein
MIKIALGGWQRIGVVLSILWFIVGGLWINSVVTDELGASAVTQFGQCLKARSIQPDGTIPRDTNWDPCQAAFERDFLRAIADRWYWTLVFTLIPIPIVWLICYGLLALARWIRAGFAAPG